MSGDSAEQRAFRGSLQSCRASTSMPPAPRWARAQFGSSAPRTAPAVSAAPSALPKVSGAAPGCKGIRPARPQPGAQLPPLLGRQELAEARGASRWRCPPSAGLAAKLGSGRGASQPLLRALPSRCYERIRSLAANSGLRGYPPRSRTARLTHRDEKRLVTLICN